MKQVSSIGGREFKEMFDIATKWLEKSAADIDAMNVFPVPDGDTGTNMLLTMRSSVDEASQPNNSSVATVVQAMAHGALMGARGNSGVILSQIWNGLAQGLQDKQTVSGKDFAEALEQASILAYRGIMDPVEGTILTVIRETAAASKTQAESDNNGLIEVMETAVNAAAESVANTPTLLPVLREARVVDAGGQGLYTILDGALRYLRGEAETMQFRKPQVIASSIPQPVKIVKISTPHEVPFGYCTEFMLKGDGFDPEKIKTKLKKEGESLIVVGDKNNVRIHIHTLAPGSIIRYGTSLGTLHQVSIRNMDEQHQDFLEAQKGKNPEVDTATIAVVAGEGLAEVFTSLGVTAIVSGGQTMNPSTKDILQAVKTVSSDKIIILPNNKNIILTAQQVQSLTEKRVEVVPTKTIPQGVAALLAFDYEADYNANVEIMQEAITTVKTIEITRAVRSTHLDGLNIKKNQAIGLLDGDLLAAGNNPVEILNKMLAKIDLRKNEIATIYYGADTDITEAEQVSASIHEDHPQLQVEVVRGSQPHYNYIVSIE